MAVIITKPCQLCAATSTVEVTAEEKAAIDSGIHIQYALPNRDADFRELLISGIHPKCWEQAFGGFEDEDEVEIA